MIVVSIAIGLLAALVGAHLGISPWLRSILLGGLLGVVAVLLAHWGRRPRRGAPPR